MIKKILAAVCGMLSILITALVIAVFFANRIAQSEEYKFGNDVIPSIKAVVGKRSVVGTSVSTENGISTKEISYRSDSITDDLIKYVACLRENHDFFLTEDVDLSESVGNIQLAGESVDEQKIIIFSIAYDAEGYTFTISKGAGTLTPE